PAGEITVLDAGGYGSVTITKAISIINDGVGEAGVLVSGGVAGITINAGMSDAVSLRGLTVKGIGFGGGNGIVFNVGRSLSVENCAIRTLTGADPIGSGIIFQPQAGSSVLSVSDSIVADNDGYGILVRAVGSATPTASAVLTRVQANNNFQAGFKFSATGGLKASLEDSVAANNSLGTGVWAESLFNGQVSVTMIRSVSANNDIGVYASQGGAGTATVRIGASVLTGNRASWTTIGFGG